MTHGHNNRNPRVLLFGLQVQGYNNNNNNCVRVTTSTNLFNDFRLSVYNYKSLVCHINSIKWKQNAL